MGWGGNLDAVLYNSTCIGCMSGIYTWDILVQSHLICTEATELGIKLIWGTMLTQHT